MMNYSFGKLLIVITRVAAKPTSVRVTKKTGNFILSQASIFMPPHTARPITAII